MTIYRLNLKGRRLFRDTVAPAVVDKVRLHIAEKRPWFMPKWATATTLWSRVYMVGDPSNVRVALLMHEMEHVEQFAKHRLGMPIRYCYEYVKGLLGGKTGLQAYHDISYEIEARAAVCSHPLDVVSAYVEEA